MLILPKPAKDEFALGYIGRLCHINFKKSSFEMMRALVTEYGLKSRKGAYINALALTSGMDARQFVQLHTLHPIVMQGRDVMDGRAGGMTRREYGDERNPLKLSQKHAHFCLDCVEEQRQEFGYSYWNRIHQLPGIYWCPWHQRELLSSSSSCISTMLPSNQMASLHPRLGYEGQGQFIVHRYGETMMGFMRSEKRTTLAELATHLREKAEVVGLSVDKKSAESSYLSDLVFQRFPSWWLKLEYGTAQKKIGQYFAPIDGALVGEAVGSRGYALAVSLLCDEPGAAPPERTLQ
jgi:hypothetical protein